MCVSLTDKGKSLFQVFSLKHSIIKYPTVSLVFRARGEGKKKKKTKKITQALAVLSLLCIFMNIFNGELLIKYSSSVHVYTIRLLLHFNLFHTWHFHPNSLCLCNLSMWDTHVYVCLSISLHVCMTVLYFILFYFD